MKLNISNPSFRMNLIINLLRVAAVLISYHSFGVFRRPTLASIRSHLPSIPAYMQEKFKTVSPVLRIVTAGVLLPITWGYLVRWFEEDFEFRGRDAFHGNPPRHDLLKMAHYAFHTGTMTALACAGWRINRGVPEDFQVASLLSSIYFYAVGRCITMNPAESNLMIQMRYLPAACVGIVGIARTPALQTHLGSKASMIG